jgi:hypothetical protein
VIDLDDGSDSDLPPVPILASANTGVVKRKQPSAVNSSESLDTKPPLKKTRPQPAISRPAEKKTAVAKPVTVKDKFAAAVLAEEETAREHLSQIFLLPHFLSPGRHRFLPSCGFEVHKT